MRKGVVLEVSQHMVTVLTPEGEFLQTRKLEMEYIIGQEILFSPSFEKPRRKEGSFSVWKSSAALIAAILFFVFTTALPVYQSNQVSAYMSIGVNPSIELGLNNELLVVTLEAYNKEGEELISSLTGWRKGKAAEVAEEILEVLRTNGYLKKDKQVLIGTVDFREEGKPDTEFTKEIAVLKQKEQDLELMVVSGTVSERESAVNQGLTTGAYMRELRKATTPDPAVPVQNEKEAAPVSIKQETIPSSSTQPAGKSQNDNADKEQPPAATKEVKETDSKKPASSTDQKAKQEPAKNHNQASKSNQKKIETEKVPDKKENHIIQKNEPEKNKIHDGNSGHKRHEKGKKQHEYKDDKQKKDKKESEYRDNRHEKERSNHWQREYEKNDRNKHEYKGYHDKRDRRDQHRQQNW